jgi:FkbM family methyltransferase
MSNDPRDLDGKKMAAALLKLGKNSLLRDQLINWLKQVEKKIAYAGSVRDEITGPIIDGLHSIDDIYEKKLRDGTRFKFLYRTKIARDFLLAEEENPTHVWEPQTTRLLHQFASKSDGDVLIGGAYFGDHAILIAKQLTGSQRRVHCFEPNLSQSAMLAENARLNQLDNIELHEIGLWNNSSQRLRLDGFDSFANAVLASTEEEGFRTISIDDYCKVESCKLSLIMLDIEGAEYQALQGAASVLNRDKPAIIFEVHRDYVDWTNGLSKTPICVFLLNLGYQLYALRDFNTNQEMHQQPIELIPVDHIFLEGPPHGFNMVAIKDYSFIDGELFSIVKNVSPKLIRHKSPSIHHPLCGLPD